MDFTESEVKEVVKTLKTRIVCIRPKGRTQCIFPRSQHSCLYVYISHGSIVLQRLIFKILTSHISYIAWCYCCSGSYLK